MMKTARSLALPALALAAVLLASGAATADGPRKEFYGVVQKVSPKDLLVDNRMGDKLSFRKVGDTTVAGEGKGSWNDLKKGDWVIVTWEMFDKPRKAYEVKVTPPKEEEAEDM